MSALGLYDYFRSSAAYRVRIALNLKGLGYEQIPVHLLKDGGEQRKPEYRKVNPQGLVPALRLEDGRIVTQSLAIIEYLDDLVKEPPLLPPDPFDRAYVRSLAYTVACDIHPINNLRVLQYLKREFGQEQDAIDAWGRHWIKDGFRALEEHANRHKGPYLAGDRVTLADVCLVPQMTNARRVHTDLAPFPRLLEIEANCRALEAFDKAAPEKQPDAS